MNKTEMTAAILDAKKRKKTTAYRFQEIIYVYGSTIKELIEEKFGPGIMSAIDFTMDIERLQDPKGDRVKVTLKREVSWA